MSKKTCTAEDISALNRTKEFTLTATFLLDTLITDPNLNAQTSKLWQILFSKSKFHPNLEIKIAYSTLAKILGKSTRTICRYISTLVKNGYLSVDNNFHANGGQSINTIYVRFPEWAINEAKKRKDRVNNKQILYVKDKQEIIFEPSLSSNDRIDLPLSDNFVEQKDNINIINNTTTQKSFVVPFFSNENNKNSNKYLTSTIHLRESSESYENLSSSLANSTLNEAATSGESNPGKPKIKELNQKITEKKRLIDALNKKRKQSEKDWLEEKDPLLKYHKLQVFGKYDSIYESELIELKRHLILLEKNQLLPEEKAKISFDNNHSNKATNTRLISEFSQKYLEKSLQTLGFRGTKLTLLLKEIYYEVSFGSLRICQTTGLETTISHAINIALKLVREQRWETPYPLRKSM